jgi:hypothetical protein
MRSLTKLPGGLCVFVASRPGTAANAAGICAAHGRRGHALVAAPGKADTKAAAVISTLAKGVPG